MKRYSAFVIAALMACTAIFFGLSSHHRKAAEMHAALDSALAQNRNYVDFTSDSLLKEVVAYFDRWGSANDRLRAHYALGCAYRDLHDAPIALLTWEDAIAAADTTSADCDFATLFRVYGQMASIYYRQFMPEKELKAQEQLCKYALCAGDTLNYIRGLLQRNDAFLALGDTAAIFQNIEYVRRLYLEKGLRKEAAQVFTMSIRLSLDNQQMEKASQMMHIFETESGFFDEQGNIAHSREVYYYYKGMYYLGINRLDSAEHWFRRLLLFPDNKLDAYHGLMSLYRIRKDIDSTYKYSNQFESELLTYLKRTKASAITQAEGMYDYSRQQQLAQEQQQRANNFQLALIFFICIGLAVLFRVRHIARKRQEEKQHLLNTYHLTLGELERTKREAEILEHTAALNEDTNELLMEKVEQIKELEALIAKMKEQIGETESILLKQRLEESDIVQTFHEIAEYHQGKKPREATTEEWDIMIETILSCHPTFYFFIQKHDLSNLKLKVCILTYLGFDNTAIEALTKANKGSISNARIALAKELFNLKSAHDLNTHLRAI